MPSLASQRPLRRAGGTKHVFPPARRFQQNLERLRRQWHAVAQSVLGGGGRDGPPVPVDVGPPHGEHLAHPLTGQQAQAEQGGPRGINGVKGLPKRAKLAGCENAFTGTLERRSLDLITWVGFK